ncbi:MAG: putative metalloendopeptidase [Ilumatobacteraceae bacterium]|nr:putative metalloendopeptidase [Ilumatobacteraceae bacterium]
MSNNRPVLRVPMVALVVLAIAGALAVVSASTSSAAGGESLNASSSVGQPAAATVQAKRLMIDVTKPIFPMQTTPRCAILDNFGDPRSGGRSHEGTDMMATQNQEVYAVVDGTLSHQVINGSPDSTLSGNSWHLNATGTSKTYYAFMHLDHFADGLANGSFVHQGQIIGYVGDTGDPGPGNYHLHFEVHPNGGAAVNALTVLTIPAGCTVT